MNLPTGQFPWPKEFLQHGFVTGIWELGIKVIADEVEEGLDVRIAGMFG